MTSAGRFGPTRSGSFGGTVGRKHWPVAWNHHEVTLMPLSREEPSRTWAILAALFAVALWGASLIATKIAVAEAAPVTVVWLRFAMGVAVMGAVALGRRQFAAPSRGDVGYFVLLGFLGITL